MYKKEKILNIIHNSSQCKLNIFHKLKFYHMFLQYLYKLVDSRLRRILNHSETKINKNFVKNKSIFTFTFNRVGKLLQKSTLGIISIPLAPRIKYIKRAPPTK